MTATPQAIATLKAIETGWVHPTLNQHNLVDEVAGIDTVPFEKKQHKVGWAWVVLIGACVGRGGWANGLSFSSDMYALAAQFT